jgi:hypothetical protein
LGTKEARLEARVAREVLSGDQEARIARERRKPEGAVFGGKKVLSVDQQVRRACQALLREFLRVHFLRLASLVLERCLSQFVFSSLRLLAVNTPRFASKIFYQD